MTDQRPPDDGATIEDLATRPDYRPTPESVPNELRDPAAPTGASSAATGRRGIALRWIVAVAGIIVVLAGSAIIVSLAAGRPANSAGLGYMPASVVSYTELRFDLPGDQRQKLASFLHTGKFPGFADQAAIEPKVEDLYDRLVRALSKDAQSYTADIQPWFGGQIAVGQGVPSGMGPLLGRTMAGSQDVLLVATITDRGKTVDWLMRTGENARLNRSTYGSADLFAPASVGDVSFGIAVTDKVLIGGNLSAVKAAVDSNGAGKLGDDPDIKAALGAIDRDYVVLSVAKTRASMEALAKSMTAGGRVNLDESQIDDTLLALVPAWSATSARFEDDALTFAAASPAWNVDPKVRNEPSDLLGHVPSNAVLYVDSHDVGPTITSLVAKFRALPETKPAFDQMDQSLSILGGLDAVVGWWGDTAVALAPGPNDTIGGGLLIKPRDAAAADRLVTVLKGFVSLGGRGAGVTLRDEDHNGTPMTVLDFSGTLGSGASSLPPGYKAEIAWSSTADLVVVGYGPDFVASVLDAKPGASLADDPRFKALLARVGDQNISASFVDVAAIRKLIEPLAQADATADEWAFYTKEIQPFLSPLDAVVQATRTDGSIDRASSILTVR